ncbi:MAG TPA: glycosyltransferase family 4 protein [Actinomycetota bacterium]|nr:glycosyltransferase family 4 protein [Actinomycetota bacterium]
MKVGICISVYRRTGGLERVAVEWARGLHRRGHDVVVFAQEVIERDPGLTYVPVGGARSPNWRRAATFPRAAAAALRAHPVDVACSFGAAVDAPTVMGTAGPHRAWFEQGRAEAPPWTREGLRRRLNPHHRVVMAVEKRIVGGGRFEMLYATSQRSADDYARLYGVPDGRVGVLANGVNMDEFRFDPAVRERVRAEWGAGERPVVLTLANEIARKGIDTLIAAFPRVQAAVPGALLVIGGPAGGAEAARLAREAGLSGEDVRTVGRIAEPSEAYAAADLFAFPTRYDPWGLVAVESLSCGTPVVCGRSAGVAEHVRDGETGILLDAVRDPAALAGAVVRGLALPASRDECRASVAHLSWERILDRVEKILGDVIARREAVGTR